MVNIMFSDLRLRIDVELVGRVCRFAPVQLADAASTVTSTSPSVGICHAPGMVSTTVVHCVATRGEVCAGTVVPHLVGSVGQIAHCRRSAGRGRWMQLIRRILRAKPELFAHEWNSSADLMMKAVAQRHPIAVNL